MPDCVISRFQVFKVGRFAIAARRAGDGEIIVSEMQLPVAAADSLQFGTGINE